MADVTGAVQLVQCSHCRVEFDRGYRISAKRAANPQFCRPSCRREETVLQAKTALATSFWERGSRQANGCLYWQGRLDENGYGRIDTGGRPQLAHRVAYTLAYGCELGDMNVCHSCDTPQCIEPKHLWLGTQADNMADASSKGRINSFRGVGEEVATSKLTEQQAREIKFGAETAQSIAARYGVTPEAVYAIRKGKNWGWLS
jgi:hypothetical protein